MMALEAEPHIPPLPAAGTETPAGEGLKTQFLASLNHEIRTPLSGIIGITDLLQETGLTAEQSEYVASARTCAENLLELLNTTLEYSALAAGTLTLDDYEYNLAETLELAVEEHGKKAKAKGLEFCFLVDKRLPVTVLGDPRRVRQMISQVAGNAVKFTHEGRVEVRATLPSPGELVVIVEDTGIGIEPAKMSLIFESFKQVDSGLARSYSGLGLGLALAQKIAALQGGRITAESEPGRGSRFTLSLPLHAPALPVSEPSAEDAERPRTILVVEDNRVAQTVISHVLKRHHFQVACANSGRQAIDAAAKQPFDLILMDLQMPEMDGLEATSFIRALPGYAEVPILALTATYSDECRAECQRAGMRAFLSKPVGPAELLTAVKRFL